jgi:hypothetical protein
MEIQDFGTGSAHVFFLPVLNVRKAHEVWLGASGARILPVI